jgi:hypothetical protein
LVTVPLDVFDDSWRRRDAAAESLAESRTRYEVPPIDPARADSGEGSDPVSAEIGLGG